MNGNLRYFVFCVGATLLSSACGVGHAQPAMSPTETGQGGVSPKPAATSGGGAAPTPDGGATGIPPRGDATTGGVATGTTGAASTGETATTGGASAAGSASTGSASTGGSTTGALPLPGGTGSSPSQNGTLVQGPIAGHAFQLTHAYYAEGVTVTGQHMLAVKLSDTADDCVVISAHAHRRGANSLWLRFVGDDFSQVSVDMPLPGDPSKSSSTFYNLDSTCASTLPDAAAWAVGGKAALHTLDASHVSGDFALYFGSQRDLVKGGFTAEACPAMAELISNPQAIRVCQ